MQVTLASRRSPDATSNEDFIAATPGVVVVIDGASVPAGLGTGCRHGTAWFAHRLGTQLLALLTTQADHSPADSLAQAITDVAALHADTCDLDHPGSPSTTVAILREQPEAVDYLVLGDPTILLEEPTGLRDLTDDRLEHVAAVQHALTDTVARHRLRRAAVLSDGATRLVDRFGLLDWPGFLDVLGEQGPDAIITQVRAAEASDPDGRRWPRGKRHDDATAVHVVLNDATASSD